MFGAIKGHYLREQACFEIQFRKVTNCVVIDASPLLSGWNPASYRCHIGSTLHGLPQAVSKGPDGIIAEVSTLLAEEVEWRSHEVVRLL